MRAAVLVSSPHSLVLSRLLRSVRLHFTLLAHLFMAALSPQKLYDNFCAITYFMQGIADMKFCFYSGNRLLKINRLVNYFRI